MIHKKPTYQELQNENIKLKEKLIYFEDVLDNDADNLLVFNVKGEIIFINAKKSSLLGYETDNEKDLKLNIFDMIIPEDKVILLPFLKKFILKDNCTEKIHYKLYHKNKTIRYVEGTVTNKINSNIGGIILNYKDVTKRIEAQKMLKKQIENYASLNEKYIIQNKELLQAKDIAEESNRVKTAFLANMSHEIRTPMNSILGFLNFLKDDELDPKKRKQYIEYINHNGNHLLNLINDILNLSKIDANQLDILETDCKLNDFLKSIFQTFKQRIKQNKDLSFFWKNGLIDGQDSIKVDVKRLQQILNNLISNAEKFTSSGLIEISYKVKGEFLQFSVKDSGIGISKNDLPIIFDRFRQADISSTREYGGSGLGLSISKSCAKLLGGDLWVKSKINQGSTFYFTIAYKPIKNINVKEKTPLNIFTKSLKGKNILIVDDDNFNTLILENILEKLEVTIYKATNGVEAIEICQSNPQLDIVLMDTQMPILDGLEATKRILKFRPNLAIISQSANAMEVDKLESFRAGCIDYISKPIDSEVLIKKINMALLKKNHF